LFKPVTVVTEVTPTAKTTAPKPAQTAEQPSAEEAKPATTSRLLEAKRKAMKKDK
jgi:hypothetical protein